MKEKDGLNQAYIRIVQYWTEWFDELVREHEEASGDVESE